MRAKGPRKKTEKKEHEAPPPPEATFEPETCTFENTDVSEALEMAGLGPADAMGDHLDLERELEKILNDAFLEDEADADAHKENDADVDAQTDALLFAASSSSSSASTTKASGSSGSTSSVAPSPKPPSCGAACEQLLRTMATELEFSHRVLDERLRALATRAPGEDNELSLLLVDGLPTFVHWNRIKPGWGQNVELDDDRVKFPVPFPGSFF